jgi:uncharacterized protein (DUF1800 family)
MDTNVYDEPTLPWPGDQSSSGQQHQPAVQSTVPLSAASGQSATSANAPAPTTPPKKPLSRRKLLGAVALGAGAAAVGGAGLAEAWQHGLFATITHGPIASNMQIGHLLRKAGFGASAQDMALYQSLGFEGAVNRLLNYQQVNDDETENRLSALNLQLSGRGPAIADIQRWWLLRMAWTQRPLLEKMTLFWHGVLTSSFTKAGGIYAAERMLNQNQFLRAHAFDTFDNILLGITADPAMLFYLDLTKSHKNAPNENYARELMELFTVGVANYTQQDVFGAAAALTGWHITGPTTSRYFPKDHNNLVKNFMGQRGNFDYKDIIRILTNHPAAPWFITRKLFTFFVYENPSNDDLSPLVDVYVKSGHNMGEVMRALLFSPQFSSAKAYRSRLKSPVEFVVGVYRALNIQGNGQALPAITTVLGQQVFNPPNVAGWPGDKVSAYWLNSGTWMNRLNYIDLLLVNRNQKAGVQPPDFQAIVDANKIASPEQFVDYYASFLLDGNITAQTRDQLVSYFTSNSSGRPYPTITLTNGKSYPLSNVRGTLYLMMGAPEYQLN